MSESEKWVKVKTKTYYAAYRKGKVGEIVECWFGNVELQEHHFIFRKVNGDITVIDEDQLFRDYEPVVESLSGEPVE